VKLKPSIQLAVVFAALCLLSIGISGCTTIQSGGYEFKPGVSHPQEISDLIKNGTTVLLFITKNNCPDCDAMKPKIDSLQSQLNGTTVTLKSTAIAKQTANATKQTGAATKQIANATKQAGKVAFVSVNVEDNQESLRIGSLYSQDPVIRTPTIVVIRPDGAMAVWKGPADETALKSAIQDALKWK
jgi:thiol-disulfide isomerase/thioredoxin